MAGGDDTTPDPLFKNVPQRPRSAAGGISVSGNASPPATSVAASSNKRPAASSNGGGRAEHVPRAKKRRVDPVEEPEPEDAKDRGVGALDRHGILGGNGISPALLPSASSSEAAEPAVDWAENERYRRKGKAPVVNDDACGAAVVARRLPDGSGPGLGKLLGDAIRCHGSTAAVAVGAGFQPPSSRTKPNKKPAKKQGRAKKPKRMKMDRGAWFWCGVGRDGMSSAGSDADYSFDRIGVVSDRLRATLSGLGVAAPAPVRVYGRFLTRCDRAVQQTRLLMSSKRWRAGGAEFPLCAFLTEEEKDETNGEGLSLTVYDRGGEPYVLTLRFLESNGAYRLINKWGEFLRGNGLDVSKNQPVPPGDDVMLDLWVFRPPGGKLGMVMLHYRRGDAAHADPALDEVERKRLIHRQRMLMNNAAAAADADADDAGVVEDVVVVGGDANEVGDEDAGVNGEVAAAAPAPSSPSESSEPPPNGGGGGASAVEAAESGGGGAPGAVAAASSPPEPEPDGVGAEASAAEEQAGALREAFPVDAPSTSSESELHGGNNVVTTAIFSLGGGDGTEEEEEEEEQEAGGGALMVMVLEVAEAATHSSLDSNAGGAANEAAAPPSSPEQAGGGSAAAMIVTEEDEEAAQLARSWKFTMYEFQAAQGLLMLAKANSNS